MSWVKLQGGAQEELVSAIGFAGGDKPHFIDRPRRHLLDKLPEALPCGYIIAVADDLFLKRETSCQNSYGDSFVEVKCFPFLSNCFFSLLVVLVLPSQQLGLGLWPMGLNTGNLADLLSDLDPIILLLFRGPRRTPNPQRVAL